MTAFERLYCDRRKVPRDGPIFPADVFKIRTLSVRVPIEFFPRVSSATFLASVRNIRLWTHPDLPMFDPEMAGPAGAASQVREIVEQIPAPISFAFSLRVTY